jgi:hypothetical protein
MSIDIASIITAALSGSIGSVIAVIFSLKRNSGIKNELKATKAEIERLKTLLNKLTPNPLTLTNGIYYDSSGNPYCAACYGSVYNRTPLKQINQQGTWKLYSCPSGHEEYPTGTPPPVNPKRYNIMDNW